jgi:hypothetical protein
MTTDLLTAVLDAHGGLAHWQCFSRVSATIVSGGLMFEMKGQPQDPTPRRMTVALQREWASVQPFGADDQRTDFTPGRVAIEKLDGRVVAERDDPRQSFAGHVLATPWDPLQRAYFNGYALWTYLTARFCLRCRAFRSGRLIRSSRTERSCWAAGVVSGRIRQPQSSSGVLFRARPAVGAARLACRRGGGILGNPIHLEFR